MKALLVVAHGSRRVESNEEVRDLTGRLSRQTDGTYDLVQCAFLELAEPSIPDGLRAAIRSGATQLIVVPYFLSAGRHVVTDIPAEIDVVRKEYPDIEIMLAPYVGAAAGLTELILQQALQIRN
jgi:sirohydrochlorin ferrochelatase